MQLHNSLRREAGKLVASSSQALAAGARVGATAAWVSPEWSPPHRHWARCSSVPLAVPPVLTAGSLGSMGWGVSAHHPRPAAAIPGGVFPPFSPERDPETTHRGLPGFSGGGQGASFIGIGAGLAPGEASAYLMAVPKRKVTPSRKGKRNQFRRIKFVAAVQRCLDCGKAKLPHIYCLKCSRNIYPEDKEKEKEKGTAAEAPVEVETPPSTTPP